jgi:Domain of unknown function (DUF4157)
MAIKTSIRRKTSTAKPKSSTPGKKKLKGSVSRFLANEGFFHRHSLAELARNHHRQNAESKQGSSVPGAFRKKLETLTGVNLADVKIHHGAEAARMNHALHAEAFTYGRNIYFGEGKFNPSTREGQRLLSHEMAHVAQQDRIGRRIQRTELKGCDDKATKIGHGKEVFSGAIEEAITWLGDGINMVSSPPKGIVNPWTNEILNRVFNCPTDAQIGEIKKRLQIILAEIVGDTYRCTGKTSVACSETTKGKLFLNHNPSSGETEVCLDKIIRRTNPMPEVLAGSLISAAGYQNGFKNEVSNQDEAYGNIPTETLLESYGAYGYFILELATGHEWIPWTTQPCKPVEKPKENAATTPPAKAEETPCMKQGHKTGALIGMPFDNEGRPVPRSYWKADGFTERSKDPQGNAWESSFIGEEMEIGNNRFICVNGERIDF